LQRQGHGPNLLKDVFIGEQMRKLINRSGGRILVDALRTHGVDTAFGVAGESYLDVLNAFYDTPEVNLVTCRQEGGASFMAESYGKLTGKPGICFVTRGPGACNAAIGVHTAMQGSTPMILFVGQVARDQLGREAFQEIDYSQMFVPPITKWAAQIESAERIPEMLARAFQVATSGRPGPVVLALPEDMLRDEVKVSDTEKYVPIVDFPGERIMRKFSDLLMSAEKPMAILGGSGWTEEACKGFEAFAKSCNLPVATAFRRQDAINNRHDCYIGELGTGSNPKLLERVKESDLIIAVGTRLSEITTQGYTILKPPVPTQKLVHIFPSAEELGRVYQPDLAIVSDIPSFCRTLEANKSYEVEGKKWQGWLSKARQDYLDWTEIKSRDKFELDIDGVTADLRVKLPEDVIITTDAGNFSGWAQRYIRYGRPGRLLAPTSGAMGYAVPSAVAASIVCPDRTVIGMMGDGGFMMTGQELATAMHMKSKPIIMLFNNGMYGTIRMHQEKNYPNRVVATDLTNPDFTALAQSYGANGFKVTKNDDFIPALEEAMSADKASVIELVMDPEQITTRAKISEL